MEAKNLFIMLCCIPGLLGIVNASLCCLFDYNQRNTYKKAASLSVLFGVPLLGMAILLGLILGWGTKVLYFEKAIFSMLIFFPLLMNESRRSWKDLLPFKGVLLFMAAFLIYVFFAIDMSYHDTSLFAKSQMFSWALYSGLFSLFLHNLAVIFKRVLSEKTDSMLGLVSSAFVVFSGTLFFLGIITVVPLEYMDLRELITTAFKPFLIAFFIFIEVMFIIYELKKNRKFLCSIENFCFSLSLLFLFGTLIFCG